MKIIKTRRGFCIDLLKIYGIMLLSPLSIKSDPVEDLLKLDVILIWGTDEPKLIDPKSKPLSLKLLERFRKVFKWKEYYEISRQNVDLPAKLPINVRINEKWTLKLQKIEQEMVEVTLMEEGKITKKIRYPLLLLKKGELLVLAGEDIAKSPDAWFIVIVERQENKPSEEPSQN